MRRLWIELRWGVLVPVGYRLRPYDDRLDARRWWFERPGACSRNPSPRRRWWP